MKSLKRVILNKKYIKELNELLALTTHHVSVIFASDCANHLMERLSLDHDINYQARHAILAGHRFVSHDIGVIEARAYALKIHAIAKKEENVELIYFYRACGHAAATAHVKRHAIHASNYVIKSLLSMNQANDQDIEESERNWQIKRLLDLGLKA